MFQLHAIFFILMDSIKHKKNDATFDIFNAAAKKYQIEFHD